MKRKRQLPLVAVAAIAVVVEIFANVGWWRWTGVVEQVAMDPPVGAARLSQATFWTFPATVWWSRHVEYRDLVACPPAAVAAALDGMGRAQIRWFPADPHGPENLARARLIEGELDAGAERLDHALVRDPTSAYLHRLYALVLRQRGELDGFMHHLAEAEGIRARYRVPPVDLTPEDERWVRIQGLRRHLELYPRQRVAGLISLANGLREEGELGEALGALAEVEDHPQVRLLLAEWAFEEGQYAAAIRLATEVAEVPGALPSSIRVSAWALLSRAADLSGDAELADHAAAQALRLDPSSAAPYMAMAVVAERRGDFDSALKHLRRAWGIAPTDVQLLLKLSTTAEKAGHLKDARLALERAVEIDADNPGIAARLVDLHLRHGDYMAAAMRLSRSLDRFPTDPRLLRQAELLRKDVGR